MNPLTRIALLAILATSSSLAHAQQTDAQTLQAILAEMREIHNDVRLSQTTQILLSELQMQHASVTQAKQHRDQLRTTLTQLQANQKNFTTQLTMMEDNSRNTVDPIQKQRFADMQQNLTSALASAKTQEQEQTNTLQDAENALRKEQDALDRIQGQLDEVVLKLKPTTSH